MRLRQPGEDAVVDDGGLIDALRHERLMEVRIGPSAMQAAAALDADAFEIRDAASKALLDPGVADAELWALLDRDTLSREARERLLDAACRRVMDRPRGALGIRMGTSAPPRTGVVVQSTVPGLPADRVLLPGDLVQRVDGVEVGSVNDLANALQRRAPGVEVRLQVLRNERDAAGKPMQGADGRPVERQIELQLPLGNAADLERVDRPDMRAGLSQVSGVVLQQRRLQVSILQQRFVGAPRPATMSEPADRAEPDAPAR